MLPISIQRCHHTNFLIPMIKKTAPRPHYICNGYPYIWKYSLYIETYAVSTRHLMQESNFIDTQRTHNIIISSSRQNDVATSFRRNNDVIITSYVRWVSCQKRVFLQLLGFIPQELIKHKNILSDTSRQIYEN